MALRRLVGAAVVAMLLGAAGGCSMGPSPVYVERGWGQLTAGAFDLRSGTYVVTWNAADDGDAKDGCLFGAALLPEDPQPDGIRDARVVRPGFRKIAYEALPAGTEREGSTRPVAVSGGTYRLRTEGTCAWRVMVIPHADVAPTPEGNEQRIVNDEAARP